MKTFKLVKKRAGFAGEAQMDKFDRIYQLHQIFSSHRYPVAIGALCRQLECSEPTIKRLVREMRLYLDAPIINERGRGYYYDRESGFQLPGLWFSAEELHALLSMQLLLSKLQPGFLEQQIAPIRKRIEDLLEKSGHGGKAELHRIRILSINHRTRLLPFFPLVAGAVLERRRLSITYHARGSGEVGSRTVSPQRLVHYRDNWYLDAWCHKREGLRCFALERIGVARLASGKAKSISARALDKHYASSYGIFSGKPLHTAVLRFTAARARWVSEEEWHPDQSGRFLDDGSFELQFPYHDPTELVMDICRYGPDVTVKAPLELRRMVLAWHERAASLYR